jgi:hypothetical protein
MTSRRESIDVLSARLKLMVCQVSIPKTAVANTPMSTHTWGSVTSITCPLSSGRAIDAMSLDATIVTASVNRGELDAAAAEDPLRAVHRNDTWVMDAVHRLG